MKKKYVIAASLLAVMGMSAACSSKSTTTKSTVKSSKVTHKKKATKKLPKPDYATAEDAEAALNAGKVLEGKTVRFRVNDLRPKSAFGYNLETGQHLNFVSPHNPKVKVGDIVIVKVKEVTSTLGSFVIKYSNLHKVPLRSLSKAEKDKLNKKPNTEDETDSDSDTTSANQNSSQRNNAKSTSSNTQNVEAAKQQSKPKSQGEINKELGHDPKGAPLLPGQDHAAGANVNGDPDPWVQGQIDWAIREGYMNPDGTDTEKGKQLLQQGSDDEDADSNNSSYDTNDDDSSYDTDY
ncbi:hypothetical protein [Lactobacillus johnsonii]|uniref:Uncharacterized protein n=1 Tax=Lactobacillus johnsonii ATCC 33200 TaxID=525330 RepID=C2E712_LACJH|nr:hypothetical protein [Lactobacillus johnsonii]EEJ59380.1 hypothetical protein HMPREF0528_1536 [Lactobacillus johnsonii ATCC 33200]KRK56165.1 hypothetical protein FC22_GL000314 [Lactobacillus johnsonii ATCC 33200]MCF0083775.1 hypothetical protein [Lactobacillus johnsonii]MCT3323015.1 hypothetical protein [Lactobacillus johnsonii]MCT3380418.1 hypothetical protein [Lactobacillus johnsonii]